MTDTYSYVFSTNWRSVKTLRKTGAKFYVKGVLNSMNHDIEGFQWKGKLLAKEKS